MAVETAEAVVAAVECEAGRIVIEGRRPPAIDTVTASAVGTDWTQPMEGSHSAAGVRTVVAGGAVAIREVELHDVQREICRVRCLVGGRRGQVLRRDRPVTLIAADREVGTDQRVGRVLVLLQAEVRRYEAALVMAGVARSTVLTVGELSEMRVAVT